jgi:sulfate adenylyltransferase subunit 2
MHWAQKTGLPLFVRYVEDSNRQGKVKDETGYNASRKVLQTDTLLDAIEELKIDAAIGGGRRTKKKPAPRNVFSHPVMNSGNGTQETRDPNSEYLQRPKKSGEHFRVFPISN